MKQRIIDPAKIFQGSPNVLGGDGRDINASAVDGLKPTRSSIETAKIREWEDKLFRIILSSLQTHDGNTFGSIIGGAQLYLNEPVIEDLKAHILGQYLQEEAEIKAEESNKPPQTVHRPEHIPQNSEQPQKKRRRRRRGRGGGGNNNINSTNK